MIRMLIVDDERIDREGVAYLTRKFEFPIETCMAESGEEAMQVLDSQRVDILFTDISMPEQDGLELIRQAKEHQPGLHCVIYSAFGEFDYAKRAMQYGVRHYILKPLKLEEFRATIQAVLEDCRGSCRRENSTSAAICCSRTCPARCSRTAATIWRRSSASCSAKPCG